LSMSVNTMMMDTDPSTKARVYDGSKWEFIDPQQTEHNNNNNKDDDEYEEEEGTSTAQHPASPMKPLPSKNGDIFVSVTSYRDGSRCGDTLYRLFHEAKEPHKVFVGVVEQNAVTDKRCVVEYCRKNGVEGYMGHKTRKQDPTPQFQKCPHYDQIRVLAVADLAAKGPTNARALQRKLIGNEEFCLQLDSHSDVIQHWDVSSKREWNMANNEYAVISTTPPDASEKGLYEPGGEKHLKVNRLCHVKFNAVGLPMYDKPKDGIAENLRTPLLSHGWNAGFSFHKCHLEEAAPYDYFLPQIFDIEEFPRMARLWTRGYDVYTPTHHIVFHDWKGKSEDGHDPMGWPKSDMERQGSIKRIKTLLELGGGEDSKGGRANLGLFGLGKRRTLKQFVEFVGVDLQEREKVKIHNCGNKKWVPYDTKGTSAMDNLYQHADDLDPQPEYIHRTESHQPIVSQQSSALAEALINGKLIENNNNAAANPSALHDAAAAMNAQPVANTTFSSFTFIVWVAGLCIWYFVFHSSPFSTNGSNTIARVKRTMNNTRKAMSGGKYA